MFTQTSLFVCFICAIVAAIVGILTSNDGSDTDDDFLKPM